MNASTEPCKIVIQQSAKDSIATLSNVHVRSNGEGIAVYHCSATTRIYVHFKRGIYAVFAYSVFIRNEITSMDMTDAIPFLTFRAVEKEIKEWIDNQSVKGCKS